MSRSGDLANSRWALLDEGDPQPITCGRAIHWWRSSEQAGLQLAARLPHRQRQPLPTKTPTEKTEELQGRSASDLPAGRRRKRRKKHMCRGVRHGCTPRCAVTDIVADPRVRHHLQPAPAQPSRGESNHRLGCGTQTVAERWRWSLNNRASVDLWLRASRRVGRVDEEHPARHTHTHIPLAP